MIAIPDMAFRMAGPDTGTYQQTIRPTGQL
jgi:hypothetical protein